MKAKGWDFDHVDGPREWIQDQLDTLGSEPEDKAGFDRRRLQLVAVERDVAADDDRCRRSSGSAKVEDRVNADHYGRVVAEHGELLAALMGR